MMNKKLAKQLYGSSVSILSNLEYRESNDETSENGPVEIILPKNTSNVVSGEKLRTIQKITLANTKDYLSKTFGPMGSNSKIIKGTNQADINSAYSKDGLKVLSNIINSGPIEASIVDELISITRAVEKEVGDGTTSTVILSSLIFDKLTLIEKRYKIPPFQLIRLFKEVVEEIKENILANKKECTIDEIYNIAMVSTNGNIEVAENIANIYKEYGMDVELSVGISNTTDSIVKIYDGLTITEGYSDPAFINNKHNNTAEIRDARIYHFADPIDTMDQITLFETIMKKNIYEPLQNDEAPVPTVITCPRFSRDLSATMKGLIELLYNFNNSGAESAKPPILIITDVVASDEVIMDDISNLCGCKTIRKYIDAEIYKKDCEAGKAPTVDNIVDFGGYAELVVADAKKTKFINPKHMMESEDGEKDPVYQRLVNFLETEINEEKYSENPNSVGLLKKRLSALKANMVDYLVGGVTIADRDATKDLVEDAVKNCRSASLYGVGYAANFEALNAAFEVLGTYYGDIDEMDDHGDEDYEMEDVKVAISRCIYTAYYEASKILYGTVELDESKVMDAIRNSLVEGKPYDISAGLLANSPDGDNVKCSIMLDVNILDTLSKIITIMVTCNQCLLQASHLNIY